MDLGRAQPRARLVRGAIELAGRKMRRPNFRGDGHVVALDAGARRPSPTSRSWSDISAVSMWRSPSASACSTTRAQTQPRKSQVPSPSGGMPAPLASTAGTAASRSSCRPSSARRQARRFGTCYGGLAPRHRKGGSRRPFDDLQQRASRSTRRAFALFPVAHDFDRHTDPRREGGRSPGLAAHIARMSGLDEAGSASRAAPLTWVHARHSRATADLRCRQAGNPHQASISFQPNA